MGGWITHMSWFLSIRNPAAAVGQGGGRVCGSEAPGRGKVRFRPVPRRHTAAAWLTRRPGRASPPTPLTLRSLASMSTKTGEPRPWHCHGTTGRAGRGEGRNASLGRGVPLTSQLKAHNRWTGVCLALLPLELLVCLGRHPEPAGGVSAEKVARRGPGHVIYLRGAGRLPPVCPLCKH